MVLLVNGTKRKSLAVGLLSDAHFCKKGRRPIRFLVENSRNVRFQVSLHSMAFRRFGLN